MWNLTENVKFIQNLLFPQLYALLDLYSKIHRVTVQTIGVNVKVGSPHDVDDAINPETFISVL